MVHTIEFPKASKPRNREDLGYNGSHRAVLARRESPDWDQSEKDIMKAPRL